MEKVGQSAPGGVKPSKFCCSVENCEASYTKEWRLKEHLYIHSGEKPFQCDQPDCGKAFSRKSHLKRHQAKHAGQKTLRCSEADCKATFVTGSQLQKHRRFHHGQQLKCSFSGCQRTFRKKAAMKSHLKEHCGGPSFECQWPGCGMKFESSSRRKAHQRKHLAYPCPIENCKTIASTWSKRMKHLKTHPVEYNCLLCQKIFKKQNGLRRHVFLHAPEKPVLLCPREECKAFFTTIFNLEHHIKKDHLKILKYHCYFPGCERTFAMRASLTRHLIVHDPDKKKLQLQRASKSWKRRWQSQRRLPLVECNLSRLFNCKLALRFKPKVETDLSGLFNERKLRQAAISEVNLEALFHLPSGRKKSEKA